MDTSLVIRFTIAGSKHHLDRLLTAGSMELQ